MTILVKKVFISSKPTFVCLLCPPLCGPFSIQESAAGGLSYKVKKNVPWNILAPRAVACDDLHLRASVHLWHVSAFLCNGEFLGISCYIKIPGYTRRGPCSKNPLFMLFPEKFRKFTDSPFSPPPSPDASPAQPSSQLRRRPGPGSPRRLFLPDLPRGRRRRAFRSHPR